jgi:hypothetical protein
MLAIVPALCGAEYLNTEVLGDIWADLDAGHAARPFVPITGVRLGLCLADRRSRKIPDGCVPFVVLASSSRLQLLPVVELHEAE